MLTKYSVLMFLRLLSLQTFSSSLVYGFRFHKFPGFWQPIKVTVAFIRQLNSRQRLSSALIVLSQRWLDIHVQLNKIEVLRLEAAHYFLI